MDEQTKNEVRQIFREEFAIIFHSEKYHFSRDVELANGRNIEVGKSVGTKIGTETSQKLSVYGVTPVVQAGAIATPAAPGPSYNQGNLDTLKTAIDEIRTALTNFGITA